MKFFDEMESEFRVLCLFFICASIFGTVSLAAYNWRMKSVEISYIERGYVMRNVVINGMTHEEWHLPEKGK